MAKDWQAPRPPDGDPRPGPHAPADGEGEVERLRGEMTEMRRRLEATARDLAVANEQLRASNEQLDAMKEALQPDNQGPQAARDRVQATLNALELAYADRSKLAATVDSSDDAIIGKTLEGVITSWNRGAERMFGYAAAEAVGRPITILIPQELRDEERTILERLRRGERIEHYETVRRTKDGRVIDISLTVSPVRDARGRIVGASKVARSITGRVEIERALRASELRKSAILESAIDGIVTMDHDGRIVEFNPAAERMFGHQRADVVGRYLADVMIPPRLREAHWSGLRRFLQSGEGAVFGRRIEMPALGAGGAEFPVELSINVVQLEGLPPFFTGYLRDITERKRTELADRLLAEAGAALAGSLDYEETLQRVASLLVPALGDWCAIDLKQEDGSFLLAAIANTVPGRAEAIRQLRATFRTTVEGDSTLARVVRSGRPEVLAEITEEMLRRAAQNEEHFQMLRSLHLVSGMVVPLVIRGEAIGGVTIVSTAKDRRFSEADLALVEEFARRAAQAIDNARLFEAMRALSKFNEQILESSGDCIAVLDLGGNLMWMNSAGRALMEIDRFDDLVNRAWLELWRDGGSAPAVEDAIGRAARGESARLTGACPTLRGRPRWWDVIVTPIMNEDGLPERLLTVSRDVTERVAWDEHQKMLLAELSHRVKNTLATVQSVAMQTMRTSRSMEDFAERFQARLQALGEVHGLLMRGQWRGTELRDLVELVLQPYMDREGGQIRFAGPPLALRPQKALALHLCLHELTTNAVKHGALRESSGSISVQWEVAEASQPGRARTARLTWIESGGPEIDDAASAEEGFGLNLIRRLASFELQGEATIDRHSQGIRCAIEFALDNDGKAG